MLILNERNFVENIIINPQLALEYKINKRRMCYLLCEYFKEDIDKVITIMEQIYPDFYIEQWTNSIQKIMKDIKNNNLVLIEREYIPIYQSDIDKIQSLSEEKQQKVLFTAYVLARYYDNGGWIGVSSNKSLKDWFKLANVNISDDKKNYMKYELMTKGLIKIAYSNNVQIDMEHDNNEVMRISRFENLGNQYLSKYKQGWKMCSKCGRMFRINSNAHQLCSKCYEENHKKSKQNYINAKRSEIL